VNVSLRRIEKGNFVVVKKGEESKIIAEVDYTNAITTIYPDAVYMTDGNEYIVDELDWDGRKAIVRETDSDYYTDAISKTELKVLDIIQEESKPLYKKFYGEVSVTTLATAFKKVKFFSHENVGMGRIYLPEMEMHSTATWWEMPDQLFEDPYFQESVIGEGLRGIAYTLQNLIPLYIMCDVRDISVVPMVKSKFSNKSTIYVYDKYPGGVGLSKKVYGVDQLVMKAAREHISNCSCENGCPTCIGPPLEAGLFGKSSALKILKLIV